MIDFKDVCFIKKTQQILPLSLILCSHSQKKTITEKSIFIVIYYNTSNLKLEIFCRYILKKISD